MYKLAQLKEAEVRGVVAALIDNGVLAIDSAEQFEKTASDASALLEGYDYDINDVANAAAYSLQKQAEDAAYGDLNDQVTSALGELTLSKMAGEIDEDTFNYYADAIVKQADEAANAGEAAPKKEGLGSKIKNKAAGAWNGTKNGAKSLWQGTKRAWKAGDIREGWTAAGGKNWKQIGKGIAKSTAAYGVPGALAAGTLYFGGKKAYNAIKGNK